jgi:ABC-2 type transport system ATP-binding protein
MIECENLTKQFDNFTAVDGVSLNVAPGKVLTILGQNGAGKTTTVRMLTSVLRPTRGWARVAGYDVTENPTEVRASVGVLTEQHGLYGRMNAIEYLDYFGQIYGLDSARRARRTAELLEYFGLAEAAKRRSGEYSKGMRQKLALARALLHEPPVLILDEPTSAMDPESAQLVRHEIARLRSSQRTIILCTHNLIEAETLADAVAVIYRGKVLVNDHIPQLKRSVLGTPEYEVILAGAWKKDALPMPAGVSMVEQSENGFRYQTENAAQTNPQVISILQKNGYEIITLQETQRTLEQIYLEVMRRAKAQEATQ